MCTPLIALITPLLLLSADDHGWLGVSMDVRAEAIEVDGRTFPHGIRLADVLIDGPADRAGLQIGDVIVAAEDADFDGPATELLVRLRAMLEQTKPGDELTLTIFRDAIVRSAKLDGEESVDAQAWTSPEALLKVRQPGSRLDLIVERVRGLRTITVTLGARPESPLNVRPIPANDAILSSVTPHESDALADAVAHTYEIDEAYADLRARLKALVEQGDPFRLKRFAYVMREPFALAPLSRDMADVPRSLPDALTHAATWLDRGGEFDAPPKLATGLTPEAHAEQIAKVLSAAAAQREHAFSALTPEDRKFLEEHLNDFTDAFVEYVTVLDDTNRRRRADVIRFTELASKVDTTKLVQAAITLSAIVDPDYLQALRHDLAGKGAGRFLSHDTEFGPIVFSGDGDTWQKDPAAVLVDLGGNDFYTNTSQRPFSIVVDLGGDDLYQSTLPNAIGGAALGVSLLVDLAGDDEYTSRRWSQGSAAIGVGVLLDEAGDDVYRAADLSQGAAFCGVGLLIDSHGNDRYEAPRFAQAVGLPGGFGALIDRDGDDHYFCSGRDLTAYGTTGVFAGWGQGCAIGLRRLASGGLALLLDEAGNDVYQAGNFAQGGGYYFGWGCLVDRAGDDRYFGSRYAQAFAAHQAIGFLEDTAGNDRYLVRRDVGQSCAWDESVTILLDTAGDDSYSSGSFALAASAHNGLAVLIDSSGSDKYNHKPEPPRASPNDYHGGKSLSLWLDLGGDHDTYIDAAGDGEMRFGNEYGFFADLEGGIDAGLKKLEAVQKPASQPAEP